MESRLHLSTMPKVAAIVTQILRGGRRCGVQGDNPVFPGTTPGCYPERDDGGPLITMPKYKGKGIT